MRKLRVSKRFWLIFSVALIGLGLFLYFWFQKPEFLEEQILSKKSSPRELKGDKFEPASQIKNPLSGSWQNKDFYIQILDEDLESGINSGSCLYKVLSYDDSGREYSSGWYQRKCNSEALVGVGVEKWCRDEGRNACWVYVSSKDKAGNLHSPSGEKGSVKYYNIDWSVPEVGQVVIGNSKAEVAVRDNLKVAGCSLYFDGKDLGIMSFSVPGCEKECQAAMDWSLKLEPGSHKVLAICRDAAGNSRWGKELLLKENQPPEIISCRVQPVQGKTSTDFKFSLEASDADGDNLTFSWEFGDGAGSAEQNPAHQYVKSGTFEPKIKVSDGKGGEDICSTAWAVVGE